MCIRVSIAIRKPPPKLYVAIAKVSPNNHGNLCDIGGHGDGESLRCNVYP